MKASAMSDIHWRDRAKRMPRVKFVWGRDWLTGPDIRQVGVYWAKNTNAAECEIIYQRWLLVRWVFAVDRKHGRKVIRFSLPWLDWRGRGLNAKR